MKDVNDWVAQPHPEDVKRIEEKRFVRLTEEEVNNLLDMCGVGRDWNYQLICAVENRLAEKNK